MYWSPGIVKMFPICVRRKLMYYAEVKLIKIGYRIIEKTHSYSSNERDLWNKWFYQNS